MAANWLFRFYCSLLRFIGELLVPDEHAPPRHHREKSEDEKQE